MTIFFLSDGYKGGAATFLEQNIIYNLKKKRNVVVIDKNPKKTFPNLKKNKYLKIYDLDVIKENSEIKLLIKKFKNSKKIFFFTNYAILVYYFFFFNKIKNNSVKFILALHSGIFKFGIKTFLGLGLFSLFVFKLNSIIFGSYSSKNWWFRTIPWIKNIRHKVIFNGIDIPKKKVKFNKSLKISFIGRLEKENDPELFLEVCKLNQKRNLIFNIFGSGKFEKKITNKLKNVKFWGWSKKSQIYSNTDITVITSALNNFPYVALESQSFGIPVITAAQGDIRKIVKNNYSGYIFNKRTAQNFDFFLKKTIKNYKSLSRNSFKNAKKFDVNKSCQKIWRFLEIENNYSR